MSFLFIYQGLTPLALVFRPFRAIFYSRISHWSYPHFRTDILFLTIYELGQSVQRLVKLEQLNSPPSFEIAVKA